jgi:hypothetical protein
MDQLAPWQSVAFSTADEVLDWVRSALPEVRDQLRAEGCCLIRTAAQSAPTLAQDVLSLLSPDLMEDTLWSTPRTKVAGSTFTATEYPAAETIPPHSEMAYLRRFPRLLCFHAVERATSGGQTTVADLDAVSADLADLTAEVLRTGIRYVRVFRPGIDIPLADAFGTDDLSEVGHIAAPLGMSVEAMPDGSVRVAHECQGALVDVETGSPVWFNQVHLFHPSHLRSEIREGLTTLLGEDGLPRQAFFGDGSPIPDEVIATVKQTFRRHERAADWQPGDILLVDNLRHAHGRLPFTGRRRVHVAMGLPSQGPARAALDAAG